MPLICGSSLRDGGRRAGTANVLQHMRIPSVILHPLISRVSAKFINRRAVWTRRARRPRVPLHRRWWVVLLFPIVRRKRLLPVVANLKVFIATALPLVHTVWRLVIFIFLIRMLIEVRVFGRRNHHPSVILLVHFSLFVHRQVKTFLLEVGFLFLPLGSLLHLLFSMSQSSLPCRL